MRRSILIGLPLVAAMCASGIVAADDLAEVRGFDWTLSGEARYRPEFRDDRDLDDDRDDELRQRLTRLRLGLSLSFGPRYRILVQGQDSLLAGDEDPALLNERHLDLHQGYLEVKPTPRVSVKLGRQELAYGAERLVGAFGWSNIGRSFDGARAQYATDGFSLAGFGVRVSSNTFAASRAGSVLYGLYGTASPRKKSAYDGYLLAFDDDLESAGEAGGTGGTRVRALGARAKDAFGRFDYSVEAVIERGEIGGDDLSAHAAAAQVGVSWGEKTTLRGFAGYDFATGDENPADGEREEFFNFFPTNHPFYGYIDYEGWRNLRSPHAGVSVSHGRHFAQAKAHRFLLEEEQGPWKNAGGAVFGFDPSGGSGSSVGTEIDLTYRFRWREKLSIEAGASRFEPGRFARRTRGEDESTWGYLMFTWGFDL